MATESSTGPESSSEGRLPVVSLVCGVLAVLLAIAMFWLIIPPVLLGIAATVLAVKVRKNPGSSGRAREFAAAGMALGLAAILFVPGAYLISEGGEEYGRDCALMPNDSDC